MKLKYYLRGIGIGIIVTAIILSIVNGVSNSSNKMTNPQIVEKAKELGMVTKDEYDIVKQDLNTAKGDIDDLKAELSKADTKENKESDDGSNDSEETQADAKSTDESKTDQTDSKSSDEEKAKSSDKAKLTDPSQMAKDISFTISSGMGSEDVAKVLEQKGIIVSASEFNKYLVESGNANYLQIGEFKADEGESYDSIISKITKR